MKKILLMSLLCLTIVACGKKEEAKQETAETTNVTQEQDYGVPNPYEIVDTLDEASKIAGFNLSVPATYGDYKKQVIQAIEDDMIEVIYFNDTDNEGLRIRKAKGTDDISGDYNEYKNVETVKVGDYDVTEKSDGKNIFVATWTDGTYSYAIDIDRAELSKEDIENLISNIKLLKKGCKVSYNGKYTLENDEWIATIPIGYADGISRSLSCKNFELVLDNGEKGISVGNICMDQMMIKLPEKADIGTKVYIFGYDNKSGYNIAKLADTIIYEIVCGINKRVKREYEI